MSWFWSKMSDSMRFVLFTRSKADVGHIGFRWTACDRSLRLEQKTKRNIFQAAVGEKMLGWKWKYFYKSGDTVGLRRSAERECFGKLMEIQIWFGETKVSAGFSAGCLWFRAGFVSGTGPDGALRRVPTETEGQAGVCAAVHSRALVVIKYRKELSKYRWTVDLIKH